jgi:hypothetical protein
MYTCTVSLSSSLDGGGWLMPHRGCFTLMGMTWCPLYSKLCGPQQGQVFLFFKVPRFGVAATWGSFLGGKEARA